jgi:hypothetical protein
MFTITFEVFMAVTVKNMVFWVVITREPDILEKHVPSRSSVFWDMSCSTFKVN